jgi:hypothetical protein
MSKLLQRLNVVAIGSLACALTAVLTVQLWPRVRLLAGFGVDDDPWAGPKTLQVCASHPGDPVRLVKITKAGKEVVPGQYRIPQIKGRSLDNGKALLEWLTDVSFTLRNQSSKSIVSDRLYPTDSTNLHNRRQRRHG